MASLSEHLSIGSICCTVFYLMFKTSVQGRGLEILGNRLKVAKLVKMKRWSTCQDLPCLECFVQYNSSSQPMFDIVLYIDDWPGNAKLVCCNRFYDQIN
jgi:hypothetical protein